MSAPRASIVWSAVLAIACAAAQSRTVSLPAIPDPHGLAGAFAGIHGGRLIAGGGANFPGGVMPWDGGTKVWHDRVFALDPADPEGAWHDAGRLPAPNGYGVSLTLPEGVLIAGGSDASHHFSTVWLMTLDGDHARFRALPSLPVPLAQMAGALAGRHVHLTGGIVEPNAVDASARHWHLDLDAIDRGWVELPPLPSAGRILATAAAIGDDLYVVGGCSLAPDSAGRPIRTYLRDAWRFSGGAWSRLPDLPRPSAAAASPAPVVDRSLFVVSGDDGRQAGLVDPSRHTGFTRDILRYDAATGTWHHAGTLAAPPPVTLPAVPWRDGFIFVNGEVRPGVRTNRVFLFIPPVQPA